MVKFRIFGKQRLEFRASGFQNFPLLLCQSRQHLNVRFVPPWPAPPQFLANFCSNRMVGLVIETFAILNLGSNGRERGRVALFSQDNRQTAYQLRQQSARGMVDRVEKRPTWHFPLDEGWN